MAGILTAPIRHPDRPFARPALDAAAEGHNDPLPGSPYPMGAVPYGEHSLGLAEAREQQGTSILVSLSGRASAPVTPFASRQRRGPHEPGPGRAQLGWVLEGVSPADWRAGRGIHLREQKRIVPSTISVDADLGHRLARMPIASTSLRQEA